MNKVFDLDLLRHQRALTKWLGECKHRMSLKFPEIHFESDYWPIRTLYKTEQAADCYFTTFFAPFKSEVGSFCDVVRGLVAEFVVNGKPKKIDIPIRAFSLLAELDIKSIFEITLSGLRKMETACLNKAREHPASAMHTIYQLTLLKSQIDFLTDKGVIPRLGFHVRREVMSELAKLAKDHEKKAKTERSTILDHKIEAFNDALNALYDNDPRLSAEDRMSIAITTRSMCAPSRINEILCSSIDDHITVEDYAQKPSGCEFDALYRAHQMLLITSKGSKGATWGAKPALNFMIDAFHYTTEVIKQHSQRSRTLIEWYQQHPNTLYLPAELEYLRGKDLFNHELAKIIYLTENPSANQRSYVRENYFVTFKSSQFVAQKRDTDKHLRMRNSLLCVPFKDVEQFLLQKVHLAMEQCRKVTQINHYQGDLSKMLCLFDSQESPFLPRALNYKALSRRLKYGPSLFEKLGITMPVKGRVEFAWIETHDPRRWLNTQALRHGEKLSNVLINKWSNRLKLAQLKAYDLRSDEELASFSRMPAITELDDISKGIEQVSKIEEEYGLKSEIVTVSDADISLASMDLVLQAVEDRPVARTSDQIIILYPSQFGVCLHQHYETPCRNYDSCLPCESNVVVKGHMPSNDKIRSRSELIRKSIVRQLDKLVTVHNRGIADEPESLAQHMFTLVEKGLDIDQMADNLIDDFHEIKDIIKDKLLFKRLEEAFVARGFVKRLDDKENPAGALMKYHNPTNHASPGLEKALDSHGGREQILNDERKLISKYPQFAAKALNLKDERHLLTANGDDCED
jgi:regulator of replication initiation timing